MRATAVVWIALVVPALACGRGEGGGEPGGGGAGGGGGENAATIAGAPHVTIVAPAEGDSVGSEILVRLDVTGAQVVPATGVRVDGEGHHHVFVDADPTADTLAIPKGPGIYHLGTGVDTLRLTGLAPGPHRLIAVFAYGDHVAMTSVAPDTLDFVVRPE